MPPSGGHPVASWRERLAALSTAWRQGLLRVGLAWMVLFVLLRDDWAAMADQWWNSSTYNHILLVPLILVWLVEQRAASLMRLAPSGWWPGLLLFAGAAILWVLGVFAGVATARQLGVVAMHGAVVLALLGPRVGAGLAFPLAYAAFLVPIGDELVPALQMVTAKITIALVHLSGVPAVIDGVFIDTPAGLFEVAEACSGVKFLVAMIAFGVLVANACFVSWRRRAVFLAACIIVPILANGIRAWGTIFAAQFVGVEVAAGFDHIVYGWMFFAVVLALVVAGGWRYFDRPVDDPMIDAQRIMASPRLSASAAWRSGGAFALAAIFATVLATQLWVHAAERLSATLPGQLFLPDVPGWHRVDYAPSIRWEPRASGADHRLLGRYADGEGREVDVFLAVYSSQRDGREAGGFGEGALPPDSAWAWLARGTPVDYAASDRLLAEGRIERIAETRYRTGDLLTGSNARLKLANMIDRLLLRSRPTMVLILSAEEGQREPARDSLAAFRVAAGPLDRWMDRIAGLR